ncbi:MAG: S-layer homology domain-containing protein [Clostridiales Family XIII bacterium]|jgi:uncharacterized protein with FMN-binding domain|nr:S-layer homology domain-containing protein [Clostridiales Family XIII bacterium]
MKVSIRKTGRLLSLLLALALALSCVGSPVMAADGYRQGVYLGAAQGRGGSLAVYVTVGADGKISAVEIGDNGETASYLNSAKAVIPKIIEANGVEGVDAVSGATISSRAIINAVAAALSSEPLDETFESGTGTAEDPYIIKTAGQLGKFRDSVNRDGKLYAGEHIKLGADLDISGAEWEPIGNSARSFAGSLDGGGHVINGLTIGSDGAYSRAYQNAALFWSLGGSASVRNLGLTDVSIHSGSDSEIARAAGVAGMTGNGSAGVGAVIDNCYVTGTVSVKVTAANKQAHAGGIVAIPGNYASIYNCWTDVSVTADDEGTGRALAGGLAAMGGGNLTLANSYALGDVAAANAKYYSGDSARAGGLIGDVSNNNKIYNCYALGDISCVESGSDFGTDYIGALAASNTQATGSLTHSYYSAEAVLKVNSAPRSAVAVGKTGSGTVQAVALSPGEMASETLAGYLNEGVMGNALPLPYGVELLNWKSENGVVALAQKGAGTGGQPAGGVFESGDGSEADPYVIKTEEQLRAFAVSLTDSLDYAGQHVRLGADIALHGEWVPVGEGEHAFAGSFDGAGHTVSGLAYASDGAAKDASVTRYVGFFGVLNGPVKNLTLAGVDIRAVGSVSVYAGGLAGAIDDEAAVIDGVFVSGAVRGETVTRGNNYVGGVVGWLGDGWIVNSGTNVLASSTQGGEYWAEVGGIAALSIDGHVVNCYSLGDVQASASRALEAGIACSNLVGLQAGVMANCYAAGGLATSDWAQDVGAVSGNTTGIGSGYFLYHNSEAAQNIGGQRPSPVVGVGVTVKTPDEDNPSVILSGFNHEVKAFTADYLKSADFAALLNGNLAKFPIDPATLPGGVSLKSWQASDGAVTPTGAEAALVYVPVVVVDDTPPDFHAGEYVGRDQAKSQTVRITVTGDSITDVTPLEPAAVEGGAELISRIIANPNEIGLIEAEGRLGALRDAIATAIGKAKIGDATGYGAANPAIFAGGDGSEANPYKISTEAQLRAFAAAINEDENFEGKHILLTSDLTLGAEWVPTGGGAGAHDFSGVFDGGGHTVANMSIGGADTPSNYRFAGFFGFTEVAAVKNLTLKDVGINNVYDGGERSFAGCLVGGADDMSYFDGVTVTGSLRHVSTGVQYAFVGGLIGFASGYGNVEANDPEGSYSVFITNCGTDVEVYGQCHAFSVNAGGIIGSSNRTYIANCYALGDVTAWSGNEERPNINRASVGGIAGTNGGYITNVYAFGNVRSVTQATDVGGVIGRHTGIARADWAYYNTDASHRSGDAALSPTPGVGYTVPASGNGSAPRLTGKSAAEMKSAAFAALLNGNSENMAIAPLPDAWWKEWAYDGETGSVAFAGEAGAEPVWLAELANPFLGEWQSYIPSAGMTIKFNYKTDGTFDYEMPGVPADQGGEGSGAYVVNGGYMATYLDFEGAAWYAFEVVGNDVINVTEILGVGEDGELIRGDAAPFVRTPGSAANREDLPFALDNNVNGTWRAMVPDDEAEGVFNDVLMRASGDASCSLEYLDYGMVYSGKYFTIGDVIGLFAPDLRMLELFQMTARGADGYSFAEILAVNSDGTRELGGVAAFDRVGSKTALAAKVEEVKGVVRGNYTSTSWNAFQTALEAARELLSDEYATKKDIDGALAALNAAFGNLRTGGSVNTGGGSGGGAEPPATTSPAITGGGVDIGEAETPLAASPFSDVKAGDWFYDDVEYVRENGLMNGTAADKFSPGMSLTRGMIVTILHRHAKSPAVLDGNRFSDVADGQYYADAVKWAAANGVASGYGDGRFGPDDNVTRQDLAAMLSRYAEKTGLPIQAARPYAAFADEAQIAAYAKGAVEALYRAGIINGKENSLFDPRGDATRAEAAAMLHRFLGASGE